MTAKPFIEQAEALRKQNKHIAASVLYRVATLYAKDDKAREELKAEADAMGETGVEVAQLEHWWSRS